MSKRKMCPHYQEGTIAGYFSCIHSEKEGSKLCPKNTNKNCEIVKPKARYKRVRAWAVIDENSKGVTYITATEGNKIWKDSFHCTILIDRKYLKGRK